MKTIVLDNVERVEYLDSLTKGRLNSIQVIFGRTGQIGNYNGPGLRLAFALLRDQFPPQTVAERIMIERLVPNPIDFDIDSDTLKISAPLDKLKGLEYKHLLACRETSRNVQLLSSGRSVVQHRRFVGRDPDRDGAEEAAITQAAVLRRLRSDNSTTLFVTGTASLCLHQRHRRHFNQVAARYAALAVFFRLLTAFDWGFA